MAVATSSKRWLSRREGQAAAAAQIAFLPRALEIQNAPPSPAGRCLLWLLLALFSIGIAWAWLGEVDIVVTAPGRVVPSGKVKLVQAPEAAIVASIHVHEGQRVKSGDPLISLEDTRAVADDKRVREQLASAEQELAWRTGLEDWLSSEQAYLPVSAKVNDAMQLKPAGSSSILHHKQAEVIARITSLRQESLANKSEQESVLAELQRAKSRLSIVSQRAVAYATLVENQYGARVQYLEVLEQQTDLEKSIPVLKASERRLVNQAGSITARIEAARSETRAENLVQIERLKAKHAILMQDARKAAQLRSMQVLRAPVKGAVQELAVNTIGAVTTPAQPMMKIVPEDAVLEVEALLQNKDIGFVNAGQDVAIKVDTFNFTKYGLIDAKVSAISNDAVEEKGAGWVFKARMQLADSALQVDGNSVRLSPGMSVTAEIKIGKRRLIEFFLSPLLRYRQESVRER